MLLFVLVETIKATNKVVVTYFTLLRLYQILGYLYVNELVYKRDPIILIHVSLHKDFSNDYVICNYCVSK